MSYQIFIQTGQNPQMETMFLAVQQKLLQVPVRLLAERAGAIPDREGGCLRIQSLGRTVPFDTATFREIEEVNPEQEQTQQRSEEVKPGQLQCRMQETTTGQSMVYREISWQQLTLLQYLETADGTPPVHQWISLVELPGGAFRGKGFEQEIDEILSSLAGRLKDRAALEAAALRLGGTVQNEKADFCAEFLFAPYFPIRLLLWLADEEFPASCKMLVDASAPHYLSTEGAGTACVLVMRELRKQMGA